MSTLGDFPVAGVPSAGACLVATPMISSGIFYRSVILLIEHNNFGTTGVILNLASQLSRAQVLPEARAVAETVGVGGPVASDSGIIVVERNLAGHSAFSPSLRPVADRWGLLEVDSPFAQQLPPELMDAQLFLGYSGWELGQLEAEIAEGSWWVVDSLPGDLATARARPELGFWRTVLARQPSALRLAQWFPERPSLN